MPSTIFSRSHETDDHVRNLHAGVVDVVLDVDGVSGSAQQADKGVAEDGVAQMADVRRLVGIDAGVLDQNLAAHVGGALRRVIVSRCELRVPCECHGSNIALQPCVDVSGARDFELLEAFGQRQFGDNFFGNLARSFAQPLSQLERQAAGRTRPARP